LSTESEIFFKIGGNLKQGENASWPQEEWTPLMVSCYFCAIAVSRSVQFSSLHIVQNKINTAICIRRDKNE